ncbi:glycosyltransferase family 2 protein [Biformimicrobium ophioploci]|uniref:Glycosyltransferase family 2 protein n=1 Tax=Biformimicrobium ophioploci TaxID=3036711 RepID=A0ABQ6M323_9GAMM|nr:glycosyltransferase family 2 protein [Microbulbifer sp. NKW57]GMG88733.1 glycosyltransferase family 2 protein [Microbulbifer sp. NKW57]
MKPVAATLAGIITFNPEEKTLGALLERLALDDCDIVVFDNGSSNLDAIRACCSRINGCALIESAQNVGVSGAGNELFRIAIDQGRQYVVLFDQDSIPGEGYCKRLAEVIGQPSNTDVAGVGGAQLCRYTDKLQPFIRFSSWGVSKKNPDSAGGPVEADFLITSGTLISISHLKDLGGFDQDLFIDNVDVEWCARALVQDYRLLGVPSVQFTHAIGEGHSRLAGISLAKVHSPFRTFYIWRNVLSLLRRNYIHRAWKINACVRMVLKLVFLFFVSSDRMVHLKAAIRGVREMQQKKSLSDVRSQATEGWGVRV